MSLYSEVQIQIDQASPNAASSAFWVDQQIYDALNEALLETWTNLKWATLTTSTIATTSGAQFEALPTSTLMIPQFIIYANVKLFPTNHDMLQDWNANWLNQTPAQPGWFVLWDQQTLRWWPKPDNTYPFVMYGIPWPTEINAGNQDIIADPLIKRAIIHRAVAYLLEASQPQLADVQEAEALEQERRYARQLRNMQGANTLRLRPTKGWTGAQFGDIRIGKKYTPAAT